jgi:hypothetical protein
MHELTTTEAIAMFCCECCGEDWDMVKNCPSDGKQGRQKCFLWDVRPRKRFDKLKQVFFDAQGSRTSELHKIRRRKTVLTPEQRAEVGARLKDANLRRKHTAR